MFTTLLAVIAVLVIGHVAPGAVASLRRFGWFEDLVRWVDGRAQGPGFWRGRYGAALVLVPPLLAVALVQWLLRGPWLGFAALLFAVLLLLYSWGPRDLDVDVEAVLDAEDPAARAQAVSRLAHGDVPPASDAASLVEAVAVGALRRWFAVLFWFLLLGPCGALGYRLVVLLARGQAAALLPLDNRSGVRWLLAALEWPVARLLALSMALAGNFDAVFRIWREAGGNRWTTDHAFLGAVARASVNAELGDEAAEEAAAGLVPVYRSLPELRDMMSLAWRMLLLWLAVLALFVIAGWVG
ncbi:regulatory signaling modulator protein AmpE [Stenotrophomonas sp. MMGLT7]|uniref:regulatory signaling modulator protein AmpE n=1 Tax=Stenotrophomonas sp. MMGLT7 TaxID=2901227 RepID=UPI001E2E9A9C|nr:regulatory signaling modulator protein AmpE [Stenotrophomonas sp. MMGLT7]MCD7097922.1 cobalamin biosynthesis protein [Stenotrophomonas sp. MMGLT7]